MREGPVLIVGSPRTGTSALTRGLRLAGYPGHNEGHFLTLFHHLARSADEWYTLFGHQEAKPNVLLHDQPREIFLEHFTSFVRSYMHQTYGGPTWLDKTGGRRMIDALPFLKQVFPDARIIYCKRNLYEVMVSRLLKFPTVSFDAHCRHLSGLMHAWRRVRENVPDWIEIDQRDMLTAPASVADRVATHLSLTDAERGRLLEYIAQERPQRSSPDYQVLSESTVDWSDDQKRLFRDLLSADVDESAERDARAGRTSRAAANPGPAAGDTHPWPTPARGPLKAPSLADTVHGVPLPPGELVFMDRDARRGYELGVQLATKLGGVGVNVRDGLLLDIGCGYGRLAYGLLGTNFSGSYVGVDILPDRIQFLQTNFTPTQPRYTFHLLDVRNDTYIKNHPRLSKSENAVDDDATERAGTDTVDFSRFVDKSPDAIVLLSVFTHMYDRDILNYLRAVKSLMTEKSRLMFTAFIFTPEVIARIDRGDADFGLPHVLSSHCRTKHADKPLSAIAYDHEWLAAVMQDLGFQYELIPGKWRGTKSRNYQDWIVASLA